VKLGAYLRVSTDRQAEEGLGLDIQRAGIKRWAKSHGHRVVEWFVDEGVSGSNGIDARTGLLDALTAIADGKVQGLVVFKLDRLARSLTIQEGTLSKVWALNAKVFSVDLGEIPEDDPNDPMRTALRQIVGVFAQLERGMIAARLRAGRRLKDERGGFAYGAPPFGFRAHEKGLVEDEHEQLALDRIHALRAEGASLREIAAALDAEGYRPRRSSGWQPAVLSRILRRDRTTARSCTSGSAA
jgi:DNA invertase Pin-like site-specific DNA recombinase